MSDIRAAESGFEFRRATSERTVLANVDRTLTSLIPEVVSSNPTVRWLRNLQEGSDDGRPSWRRDRGARGRDFDYEDFDPRPLGRGFLVASILLPVIQARLDFLMQSLYPVARIISVSDRAIELITESRQPEHIAMTLDILRDNQYSEIAQLSAAATESLPNLLSNTADLHRRRRAAALQAFEDWLSEANTFQAAFEPADEALGRESRNVRYRDRRRQGYGPGGDFIRDIAALVAYLSRKPRLGSASVPENQVKMDQRRLTLSPGEMVGLVAALQSLTTPDVYEHPHSYEMAARDLSEAFHELAREPLVQAELATLEQSIANFDPFSEPLVGPPSRSLRDEMRHHVLPNRKWSPWLRQFLTQFDDEPRWWSDTIRFGSARDSAYVQTLAFSAHSTVVRQVIDTDLTVGESWDEYIERLYTEEWLGRLRKAIARSSDSPWTRESFIAVMVAVSERLRGDGYRLSIDDQALGGIWDSGLGEHS